MTSTATSDTNYDVRYVLEIDSSPAGVIVQDGRQVRFFATSPIYAHLDRAFFRSPEQAERACRRARLGLVTYSRRDDANEADEFPFADNANQDWDATATVGG